MKTARIFIWVMLLPFITAAQGIKFDQSLSWAQVKEKAMTENKHIFLDIFATWCGPCKMMDKKVYVNDTIGSYFNEHLISVKVQMDRTKNDNDYVKSWFADGDSIDKLYKITGYPTFLIFSPNGELAGRGDGIKTVEEFLSFTKETVDGTLTYKHLLAQYQSGKIDNKEMRQLILLSLNKEEKSQAAKIAARYKRNYLDHLTLDEIATRENMELIRNFPELVNSKDKFFELFYSDPKRGDNLKSEKDFSQTIVDYVIAIEEIFPYTGEKINTRLGVNNFPEVPTPNWPKIQNTINRKYDTQTADRVVLNAKLRWYEYKKDSVNLVNNYLQLGNQTLKTDTTFMGKISLNTFAYNYIFKYSTDPAALKTAIGWMELILKSYPDREAWLDTYANLLYKSGKVNEAIAIEEKALDLARSKLPKEMLPEFIACLEKMKKGQPTW